MGCTDDSCFFRGVFRGVLALFLVGNDFVVDIGCCSIVVAVVDIVAGVVADAVVVDMVVVVVVGDIELVVDIVVEIVRVVVG